MVISKINTKETFSGKILKWLDYPVFDKKMAFAKFHEYRHPTHFVKMSHILLKLNSKFV